MDRKLKCAIVDDDPEAHRAIIELLKHSPVGDITHSFYKPSELLEQIHSIEIDVVFLDIIFPNDKLQGLEVAPLLNNAGKIIIFISGKDEYIIEACKYAGAIDVVPKPTNRDKLISAMLKAKKLLLSPAEINKRHALFFVAERKEQINLLISDIHFVKTALGDPRNKEIVLQTGERLTLMDCNFKYLLQLSPSLVQINISQLISYDIVESVLHDTIYTKQNISDKIPRILTLSKTHRKNFKESVL